MENKVDNFTLSSVSLTDVGVKRDHNEDYILMDESLGLYIVCDGMGGHAAGEVASEETAKAIFHYIKKNSNVIKKYSANIQEATAKKFIKKIVMDSIIRSNKQVYDLSESDPDKKGMGTTLVMSLVVGNFAFIAHVGDSRGYMLRNSELNQLTEDHSFVNEMVREGVLTKEQALNHPQANLITRSIGIQQTVVADFLSVELMPGDRILLCSDGLYEYFREEELTRLMGAKSISSASNKMIEVANKRGGKDNISVILVGIQDSCEAPVHPDQVTPDKKVKILQKIPLFRKMDYREINLLLEHSSSINIPENMNVINQDEEGDDMFVLLKGEVKVIAHGNEVATLKAGKYFGEMSLVDKAPRSATVTSTTPCKLLAFNRTELFKLLRKEPLIGMKVFWAFLQNMNSRLRENDKIVREIMQSETDNNENAQNEVHDPWSHEGPSEENETDANQPHRLVF
jgi:serine/threonine protein phosphatase PrpC